MDFVLLGDLHSSFGGCPIDINVFAEYFNKRNIGVVVAGGCVNPYQIQIIINSTPVTKQLAIFYHNDYSGPIDIPYNNIVLFRSSLLATKSKKLESIFPVTWVNNSVLPLCSKSNIPKLSFCGYEASHPLRTQYLDFFEKSKLVECHFVRRGQFWNGCIGDKKSKEEFEQNLLLSEFVFCPRGSGNFSIRFYETLKAGRIPVVPIDDDTVWPLSKYINWENFVVSGSSPKILVEKIIQFWEVNNIEDKQKECSDLFEKYLKTESILPYLFLEFQEKLCL